MSEKRNFDSLISFNGVSASATESADVVSNISGMNLSNAMIDVEKHLPPQIEHFADDPNTYPFNLQSSRSSVNAGTSNMPPLFKTVAVASSMASPGMDSRMLDGGLPFGSNVSPSASNHIISAELEPGETPGGSRVSSKAYLGSVLSPQKSQYGGPIGIKSGGSNHHGYYVTPADGVGLSYPGSPLASPVIQNSPVGLNMRYPTWMRNLGGGVMGPWHLLVLMRKIASQTGSKGNKAKWFDLSEIASLVIEFSADQYGSQFIQKKLETSTTDENTMVF
ncbi:hypothetical protein RHGRI_014674 [Rhododendron griersonianum]|uniref:PUM-HD domain-containing protein n=1 Tax=Rhododendron griersonianum TaxID=479676 RepID=A0AAV6KAR2_9ERIC|nr:hypothetical protein RHGRI_014674 [Rhododendron griersonianum]